MEIGGAVEGIFVRSGGVERAGVGLVEVVGNA
jgi:hypothetical protein